MLNKATFRNVKATLRNIAAQIAVHLRRLLRISKRHVVVLDAVTPNTNLTSGIRGSLEKKMLPYDNKAVSYYNNNKAVSYDLSLT